MLGIVAPNKDITAWVEAIHAADDTIPVSVWPDISPATRLLLCWDPPSGTFSRLPELQAICVMGAGTDRLEADPELPMDIPLLRLKNAQLSRDMFYHVMHCVESWRLNMPTYSAQQTKKTWLPYPYRNRATVDVTVLGLGEIGSVVAQQLAAQGYNVSGWSRTEKSVSGVKCFAGLPNLVAAVTAADVLVCLLPLKADTEGVITKDLLQSMAPESCFINVARGAHVNEAGLLDSMTSPIKTAFLDVFHEEPLPEHHPFWQRSDIVITPHVASLTEPETAIAEVIDYYQRLN